MFYICLILLSLINSIKAQQEPKIISSNKTNVILATNANKQFIDYTFWTQLEQYSDGKPDALFLISEIKLVDIQTQPFDVDGTANIRVAVGWRNPQEDAYDLSVITIRYFPDINRVQFQCLDGYSNGSISTSLYQGSPNTNRDFYGRYNVTIQQWTDLPLPQNGIRYRAAESQECILLEKSVSQLITPNATNGLTNSDQKQTFYAKIKKPFNRAGNLFDVNLQPKLNYNLTSYFGCYKSTSATVDDGTNPNQYWVTQSGKQLGCQSTWQGTVGNVDVAKWNADKKKEESVVVKDSFIEGQTTVLLLDSGIALTFSFLVSSAILFLNL